MRTVILAAIAAICLGFVGSSTVSAAPDYGTSMGAAAASLDLGRMPTYTVHTVGTTDTVGTVGYYGYGGYRQCFQNLSRQNWIGKMAARAAE